MAVLGQKCEFGETGSGRSMPAMGERQVTQSLLLDIERGGNGDFSRVVRTAIRRRSKNRGHPGVGYREIAVLPYRR